MKTPRIAVQSRLHRTMKGIAQFETAQSASTLAELGIAPILNAGERVLGVYRGKTTDKSFVVTDLALILFVDGSPASFCFDDMQSSQILVDDKKTAEVIEITLRNGDVVKLAVDGGDGRFRDVFSVGRFIARVIEDWLTATHT